MAPRAFARDARAKKLFRNSSGPAELSSAYTGRTVSIAITAKTAGALENEGLSWLCRPARVEQPPHIFQCGEVLRRKVSVTGSAIRETKLEALKCQYSMCTEMKDP